MVPPSGSHSYREFIDVEAPMYRSDWEILDELDQNPCATPHELADSRYRENVLRLQLRDLERIGVVSRIGAETYCLTEYGERIRSDSETLPASGGLFDVTDIAPETYPPDEWRLRDFSSLDGETVKQINFEIVEDKTSIYGWIEDSPDKTRNRISNVPETFIHRIIREFPTHDPLPDQCAHWVRSFAGLHFFPDANHRTATNTIEFLVEEDVGPSKQLVQQGIERTVLHSKFVRAFQSEVRFNTLWCRDELFHVWHRYFTQVLTGRLERRRPHDPSTAKLNEILLDARTKLAEVSED